MEELLLWRWSTGIQTLSVLLITAFLTFSGRREGGEVLSDWARAWQWNCVALGVTWFYWLTQPEDIGLLFARVVYATAKTAFLLYLLAVSPVEAERLLVEHREKRRAGLLQAVGGLGDEAVFAVRRDQKSNQQQSGK